MAGVSVEESITMGQGALVPVWSKLFRALISPFKRCSFRVQSLIAKQELPSPPSSTISGKKEHVIVDIPTTDLPLDDHLQASWFWSKISWWKGQSSAGFPVSITENTRTPRLINPMAQFRDQEIGKTVLTFVVPMTTGVLVVYNKASSFSPQDLSLISVSLAVGLTALWNGLLLRNTLPDMITNGIEQVGAAFIFFAFFSVLSSLLPLYLIWLPWTCFAAILLPSILSCIMVRDGACHGG